MNRKFMLFFLCLLLCLEALGGAAFAADAEELYKQGNEAYIARDYKQALDCFSKAAEEGNALAQAEIGRMYQYGQGVDKDEERALEWFGKAIGGVREAAEAGDARAQFFLGRMYDYGHALERDFALAAEWYRKAADAGDMEAYNSLVSCKA